MYFVLFIERFDFLCPFLDIEIVSMFKSHRFTLDIDMNILDGWKFVAHIFNERGAGPAVNAGNGDFSCRHKTMGGKELVVSGVEPLAFRETDNLDEFRDECFFLGCGTQFLICAGMEMAFKNVYLYVLEMPLHRENELEDLRAVRILLNHLVELHRETFESPDGILCFLLIVLTHKG